MPSIISAAEITGPQMLYPGYVAEAWLLMWAMVLKFIGPSPDVTKKWAIKYLLK